ncbi:hypothetical protein Mapa_011750 [Marchantia paleacea]|nr:hypothetical protein Mapa_011750 [Marchantia paleacea]
MSTEEGAQRKYNCKSQLKQASDTLDRFFSMIVFPPLLQFVSCYSKLQVTSSGRFHSPAQGGIP